jgi:hypothetical protein
MGNVTVFAQQAPTARMAASPHTAAGIVLGASFDDLETAYPQLSAWTDPRAGSDAPVGWYVVTDDAGSMLFFVKGGRVASIQATSVLPPAGICS